MALLTGRSTLAKAERGLLGERMLTCTMKRIRSLSAELLPSESAVIRQPEALDKDTGNGDRNGTRERDTGEGKVLEEIEVDGVSLHNQVE